MTDSPEILRYAAFTTDPAAGNPAGVVLDASELDDAAMLAVAARIGYTAFLTGFPAERTFTVRYLTPGGEIAFCGHATVAASVALAERMGLGRLVFEAPAGTIPVQVTEEDGVMRVTLTSVAPYVEPVTADDVEEALALLSWRIEDLDPRLPARVAFAGNRHLVIGAKTRQRLADLAYDFDGLAAFMTARDLTTLYLAWRESPGTFHVRAPFPAGDVTEDRASGSAAAAFGAYLRALGETPATSALTLHQGEDMGGHSVLRVELAEGDPRIRVSGAAVPITGE